MHDSCCQGCGALWTTVATKAGWQLRTPPEPDESDSPHQPDATGIDHFVGQVGAFVNKSRGPANTQPPTLGGAPSEQGADNSHATWARLLQKHTMAGKTFAEATKAVTSEIDAELLREKAVAAEAEEQRRAREEANKKKPISLADYIKLGADLAHIESILDGEWI